MMKESELKKILEAYDKKLDKIIQLNTSSIKKLQVEKSRKRIRKILIYRIFEIVMFCFFIVFLLGYIANNWEQTHLIVSGIVVTIFAVIALTGSIVQVVLLKQIDFSKPVIEIRKKIELVNSHGLLFLKLIFLSAPVWWSYAIVALDLFLGFDLYGHLDSDFVTRYIVINFLLIAPLLWFLNKLTYKNLHINWIKKTIGFLTGEKTKKALISLHDIEKFEN